MTENTLDMLTVQNVNSETIVDIMNVKRKKSRGFVDYQWFLGKAIDIYIKRKIPL